jgi:hypothetical protein
MNHKVDKTQEAGRLFQDFRFEVTHLRGAIVDELVGVIAYHDDLQPALILLKPSHGFWQAFFLDVGAGVWEQWPNSVIDDTCADDAYKHVDYAERFGLRGAEILEIKCESAAAELGSYISIRLSRGTLLLAPQDANDSESPSVVSFTPCNAPT